MNFLRVIYQIFNNISSFFQKQFTNLNLLPSGKSDSSTKVIELASSTDGTLTPKIDMYENEASEETQTNKISLARRSLMTKLYMIEQEIEVFKKDFPTEYNYFLDRINSLRVSYETKLQESKNQMTFEIDPEINGRLNWDIEELEITIKKFIEEKVKFSIFSKRLQILATKLNLLYNVSISHSNEREKVMAQLARATEVELEMVKDIKDNEYILKDARLRDRIVTLISYVDYHIFKITLRNSEALAENVIPKLALYNMFRNFDYFTAFKAFVEDEISDLGELLPVIADEDCRKIFDRRILGLLNESSSANSIRMLIVDEAFWKKVFELETAIIELLKCGDNKDRKKHKVKLISRMEINVAEEEVLTLPKTNAYLALVSIFSTTHDDKIWLLIKLIKNLSDEITYKEIYLLVLLFDVLDVIQQTPNSLKNYIEKYSKRYRYNRESIFNKKAYVLNSKEEKKYTKLFMIDEDYESIIKTLERLQIDFEVTEDSINVNSFYFNGMEKMLSNRNGINQSTCETTTI